MNFYDMESAPTDGQWVLLHTQHGTLYIGRWLNNSWIEMTSGNGIIEDAIGWLPLNNA